MHIRINFYSYFKDLTGCAEATAEMPTGSSLGDLLGQLRERFPKLVPMQKSTLAAVGVNYEDRHYQLQDNDEVSLFPPVQGG